MHRTIGLDGVSVFVEVAEAASFRGAAEVLGIPRSTVSRKLAELEEQLGARLLRRTTRRVSLTEAGAIYLRACQPALGAIDDASRAIRKEASEARGRLRVTAATTFGERYLGPVVEAYMRANPQVEMEVLLVDRQVDLVQEGFDVAIRAGSIGDTSLVAREIARAPLVCVASPRLLERQRAPRRPADLAARDIVVYAPLCPGGRWIFRVRGKTVHVAVRGRLVVNSMPLALDAAVRGLGITRVPAPTAAPLLADGSLVEVLGAFAPAPGAVHLVYRPGTQTTPRVRSFLEIASQVLAA